MRFVCAVFCTILTVLGAVLFGQDGATGLPSNYQAQFENEWVKVTAVHYGPFEKLEGHRHTPNAAAYVYLADGPAVKFRHIGGHNVVATRPPTKAGAFRVYRGLEETHAVENTGDAPSRFLRVELKTAVMDPTTFRGKFERGAPSSEPTIQFDHPQVRISRVWSQAGNAVQLAAGSEPALLIALHDGAGYRVGQERWLAPGTTTQIENTSATALDFLRFDFKTPPASTRR